MLAYSIPFSPDNDLDDRAFARIPNCGGVFLLRGSDEHAEPYVSRASNLRRRIMRLLAPSGEQSISRRLNLRERCRTIEFSLTGSDFENIVLLYRTLREVFPNTYARRMRFNFSPLIRINWENAYPRAYVTRKLGRIHGQKKGTRKSAYYGPFQSRAVAEKLLNDTLDLFKSRRCTFELHPDPTFPGCVYSEMKMCLAPCFKGCTDGDYMEEVKRVQEFLESRGQSLLNEVGSQRDKASAELDFELASAVHSRMEKIKGVARNFDEIIRRIDRLDALIVQSAAPEVISRSEEQSEAGNQLQLQQRNTCVALFRFTQGQILGPVLLNLEQLARSNDIEAGNPPVPAISTVPKAYLSELISQLAPTTPDGGAVHGGAGPMEHLAIFKRWYYRSNRSGEIFFRDAKGNWPGRRILRGVRRLNEATADRSRPEPDSRALGALPQESDL